MIYFSVIMVFTTGAIGDISESAGKNSGSTVQTSGSMGFTPPIVWALPPVLLATPPEQKLSANEKVYLPLPAHAGLYPPARAASSDQAAGLTATWPDAASVPGHSSGYPLCQPPPQFFLPSAVISRQCLELRRDGPN